MNIGGPPTNEHVQTAVLERCDFFNGKGYLQTT